MWAHFRIFIAKFLTIMRFFPLPTDKWRKIPDFDSYEICNRGYVRSFKRNSVYYLSNASDASGKGLFVRLTDNKGVIRFCYIEDLMKLVFPEIDFDKLMMDRCTRR